MCNCLTVGFIPAFINPLLGMIAGPLFSSYVKPIFRVAELARSLVRARRQMPTSDRVCIIMKLVCCETLYYSVGIVLAYQPGIRSLTNVSSSTKNFMSMNRSLCISQLFHLQIFVSNFYCPG